MSPDNAAPPIWVDAQLPPALTRWLRSLGEPWAYHVAELSLLSADDRDIFSLAREHGAIVVTKDSDFVLLQERLGSPPAIVWLTCGNVANRDLKALIERTWPGVRNLLAAGETVVEVSEARRAKDSVG